MSSQLKLFYRLVVSTFTSIISLQLMLIRASLSYFIYPFLYFCPSSTGSVFSLEFTIIFFVVHAFGLLASAIKYFNRLDQSRGLTCISTNLNASFAQVAVMKSRLLCTVRTASVKSVPGPARFVYASGWLLF